VRAHDSARIPLGFRADSAWNPGGFRLDSAGPNPTRAQPNPSLYLTLAFSSFSGLRLFASEPHLITVPTHVPASNSRADFVRLPAIANCFAVHDGRKKMSSQRDLCADRGPAGRVPHQGRRHTASAHSEFGSDKKNRTDKETR
jgi:hypothetical protein